MLARGRGRGSGRRGGRGRGRGGRDTTESTPTSPPPPGPSPTRTPPPLATTAINEALGLRAEYEDPPAVAEGESEADHLQNLRDSVARAKEAITSARLSADRFGLQHKVSWTRFAESSSKRSSLNRTNWSW